MKVIELNNKSFMAPIGSASALGSPAGVAVLKHEIETETTFIF